jgi:hypothetical protein
MQLQIETTSRCQARCVMCPHSKLVRPKAEMPMDLFRKIIDEAVTIPSLDQITLTGLGEPLLDPHLVERVRYIRSVMAAVPIDLTTNGSLLTHEKADALIAAGLSLINVSLNATNAVTRLAIMGLDDYQRVVDQIRYLQTAAAGKMRVIVKAVVAKDLMEDGAPGAFTEQWGGNHDQGGSAFLHFEGNWAGKTWACRVPPRQACGRALGQVMVLQDGRMVACCFDSEGALTFGDLQTQNLRDIYGSDAYVTFRGHHAYGRRGEIPLCSGCTSI